MREYSKQRVGVDVLETATKTMLCFGWEIITSREYETQSTQETRVYIDIYDDNCKDGSYYLYFSRDKENPQYSQFAQYQNEFMSLASKMNEPQKPFSPETILIIIGILFPIVGLGLIVATIVSRVKYAKLNKEYNKIVEQIKQVILKSAKLLDKVGEQFGGRDQYLQYQLDKLKESFEEQQR